MKNPNLLKPRTILSLFVMLAAFFAAATVHAQTQDFWQGTNGGDFNVASNWSLNTVPTINYSANNQTGTNDTGVISANDPNLTFNGFRLGNAGSGGFLQSGSTVTLGAGSSGWLRMGQNSPNLGIFTIESNAVLNSPFGATVGESGSAILNIYGGTATFGNQFIVNDNPSGSGQSGTVNQTNGTVICNTQAWIGQGTQGQQGVFNMSGGFFGCTNWFVIGRSGGNGTMNMTGGSLNAGGSGGFLDVSAANSVGTLNQSGGTITIVGNGQFVCPEQTGGNGTYNLSGTGELFCNNWLAVGRGGPGILNMSGGTIVKTDTGSDHIDIGAGGSSGSAGTGTVNQTGGMITNTTTDVWMGEVANSTWTFSGGTNYLGNLIICEGSGINCTFTLNGGFLSVGAIYSAQPVSSYSTLNLNGGTIQASGSSTGFIRNLSAVSLQPGGITLDTQGYALTIPQALSDGGGGPLIKIGSGTLTLSGANSYAGATTVSNGELSTTTASAGGGGYTAEDGTILDVSVASSGGSLAASSLTLGASSGATLQIDLGSYGNPVNPPIAVSGALTVNGTVTINVTDQTPAVGQYKLISYGTLTPGGTIQLGTIPSGTQATLVNDTASNSIDLNVTSAGAPYWNGTNAGGVWDVGNTVNWLDLVTGQPEVFRNGEPVVFNDNATGTTTVNLTATVTPGNITINNTALPYTLTGSGSITGSTGLLKEGTNIFAIANTTANTFTGPVTIDAGVLSVSSLANGGSPSAIGESSSSPTNLVLAGGTLSYTGSSVSINRGYELTDTNGAIDIDAEGSLALGGSVIASTSSGFIKGGPAQLSYTGSVTNVLSGSGGLTVAQGTVLLTNSGSGQTDLSGGTVIVGNTGNTNAALTVASNANLNTGSGQIWVGQGVNGSGILNITGGTVIVDNWLAVGRANGTGTMNMSGGVLIDNGGGGNLDIGTSAGIGGDTGTGTFNQTGGALTNTASEVWLGEGVSGQPAEGTWNMSGGTAVVGEVHVGVGGTGTSTINISGSASITESYLLLANYDGNTTANVNVGSNSQPGGTITVNADMNVGGQGTGTLNFVTNGGGKVTVTGTLYLSRFSQTADGTVNLNTGGTLVAAYINNGWGFQNMFSSPTDNPNAFNFNGGTLQAYVSSTYFIQPYVNAVVQSGGAIINDAGNSVTVQAPLVTGGGGGGLTKLGTGVLFLNGVNTYTGATLVTQGAFGIGSAGSLVSPVTIESGAILLGDEGTIQTSAINSTLTLNAGSTTIMQITPANNDEIAGLTSVSYGGALVVTNSGGALTPGNIYKLFNSVNPGTGNFSSVTIVPSGAGVFNPTNGVLTIVSSAPPVMNAPALVNGNLLVSGTGQAGNGYTILSTTNLTIPLTNWVTNTTGFFTGTGTFSNSIPVTNAPAMFFQLRSP